MMDNEEAYGYISDIYSEEDFKEFCENSVNKDKMFKNETEARNWYLQNYQDGMQVCNLYDCPIKTAKEFYGKVNEQTIKKALEQNKELGDLYETDEKIKKLLDIAMGLEGMPRQASTHACRNSNNKRSSRYICTTVCS